MKKVIFGYWYYNLGGLVGMGLGIWIIVFCALNLQTTSDLIIGISVGSLEFIFFFIVTCLLLFQFTVLSNEGVKTRTIWRTIRFIKWEDVKEIRYERYYVSVQGAFTCGWYLFDDGIERAQVNGLVSKKTHITVPASKRARKKIELFWHKPIVEKEIKYDDSDY